MNKRLGKPLAVATCAAALVLGFDSVTYAATGSSLILGKTNSAGATTTVSNTGSGPALRLVTKSSTSAPFSTNAKGMVSNLNSQYLSGQTLAQVRAGATRLNGKTADEIIAAADTPWITFARTAAQTAGFPFSGGAAFPSVLSDAGAQPLTYTLRGTLALPCLTSNGSPVSSYTVQLLHLTGANDLVDIWADFNVPASSCGKTIAIPTATTTLATTSRLVVMVFGNSVGPEDVFPTALTFKVVGYPAKATL